MSLSTLLRRIRPMRVMLGLVALFLLLMVQPRGTAVEHEGWGLITTAIIPTLVPILLFGLMLDMLMARVWQSGAEMGEKQRLKTVFWWNFLILLALVLVWGPYFSALFV